MLIPGHLAAGVLAVAAVRAAQARREDLGPRPPFRRVLLPTLVGTLTPDLIDKPLWFAGVASSTRSIGHSPWFLATGVGLALVMWLWARRRRPIRCMLPPSMWLVGVGTHQVLDALDEFLLDYVGRPTPLELTVILAALVLMWRCFRPRFGRPE